METTYNEYVASMTEAVQEVQGLMTAEQFETFQRMVMLQVEAVMSENAEELNNESAELRYELEETMSAELLEQLSYFFN